MPDPGLMPLPDAAADLDWSNLVDAAKAYEGESTGIEQAGRDPPRAALPVSAGPSPSVCVLGQSDSPARYRHSRTSWYRVLSRGSCPLMQSGQPGVSSMEECIPWVPSLPEWEGQGVPTVT